MIELTEEILEKIPKQNWFDFIKTKYNLACERVGYFYIGEDAENKFLEIQTWCEETYATNCDITEDEFLLIQNGTYTENYKQEEQEKIKNALLEAIWTMRWTENKQALYAVLEPEEAMKIANDIFIELDKIGYEIIKKQ